MSEIPENLRYTKNHQWVRMEDYYIASCGITDFAQEKLGDILYIELPATNYEINQGERIIFLESSQDIMHIDSPLSGEILEVNDGLLNKPFIINREPYEGGWLFKIDVKISFQFEELMTADEYGDYIQYGF